MAARHELRGAPRHDPRDRRPPAMAPLPPPAARPDPLLHPSQQHPRWRLRVFDKLWPWRATRAEVLRDALASRNARRDPDDGVVYLDACAFVQRDPPPAFNPWRS